MKNTMDREMVSEVFMELHDRWIDARTKRRSVEPETHENGFYQGIEFTYKKLLEELTIYDMMENDGMTEEDAKELNDKINNL